MPQVRFHYMPEDREPSPEELERRLRDLLGEDENERRQFDSPRQGNASGEPEPDPIETKLAELEERARNIKSGKSFPDPPEWNYKRPAKTVPKFQGGNYYRGLGIGLAILYAFVGPIVVGVGIGWFLDHRSGGTQATVWGMLIGVVAGFVGGILMVVRATSTGPKE